MALQSSGQISLNNVNVELGRSGSQQISMNESVVRTLAAVLSGAISFSNFWGKSNCPPNGTFFTTYCSGCNFYYRYHNGSCGYYDVFIESNSQSCGCCPAFGELYSSFCSGCDLYYEYHNGSCGYFTQFVESNSLSCGCGGGSLCGGCSGGAAPGCQSLYVIGETGFGGWGCNGYYTDDSNWAAIAVQQGLISPGQATFVTVCELGCGSSFDSCNVNGVSTNSWGSWCAASCC